MFAEGCLFSLCWEGTEQSLRVWRARHAGWCAPRERLDSEELEISLKADEWVSNVGQWVLGISGANLSGD